MSSYSIVDWFNRSKLRPQMTVAPPRFLRLWVHRDELSEGYVAAYVGGKQVATALLDQAVVDRADWNWLPARLEIPMSALTAVASDDDDEIDVSCYFGKSDYFVGSCSLPVPEAVRPAHVARLREHAVPRLWGLSYVFAEGVDVTVAGWAMAREAGAVPEVRIQGVPATVRKIRTPYAEKRFWFMPGAEWFGFEASAQTPEAPDWLKVELSTKGDESAPRFPVFQRIARKDELGPIPPDANIRRVSGDTATQVFYINSGYTEFNTLSSIFAKHGVALEDPSVRVLDWGCGCARVSRHILDLPEGRKRTYGIDIDAANVAWCRENLESDKFVAVDLDPPTPLESGSIDAVFAVSVLSHLREADAEAWLAEIARVMRRGATAVLTYNGFASASLNVATAPEAMDELETNGFLDFRRSHSLDGFIPDREYYRFVLFSDENARKMFERHFKVLAIERACLAGGQCAAVLRKR